MYQRHGDARDAIIPIRCSEKHANLIIHAYPIPHNWQQTCLGKENESPCPLFDCYFSWVNSGQTHPYSRRTLALHSGQFASPSDRHQTGTFLPLWRQPRPHVSGMSGHKGDSYLQTLRSPSTSLRLFRNHLNFLRLNIGHRAAKASTHPTSRSFRFRSENTNGGLVLLSLPTAFCVTGGVCRGFRLAWGDLVVPIPYCKDGGNFPLHDRALQVMQTPPDNKKGCSLHGDRGREGKWGRDIGTSKARQKIPEPLFFILPQNYPTMTKD